MRAFGMQLSSVMVLAVVGSAGTFAQSDALAAGAGGMAPPRLHAAYEDDALIARFPERLLDRGQFQSMTELVDSLLRLMPALTRYHKPDSQPAVLRVARAQIEERMCSGNACSMRAWYLPDEGIYLEDSLHPETDLFDRSVLFHELVHYLQEINGEGAELDACNRWYQREVQAYGLQNHYLALTGHGARVTHPGYPCRGSQQADTGTSAPARGFREDGGQALAH
jgi:hypothetical protein